MCETFGHLLSKKYQNSFSVIQSHVHMISCEYAHDCSQYVHFNYKVRGFW